MSNFTPRQESAFFAWRAALESLMVTKSRFVATNEEAQERWHELNSKTKDLECAREELEASVIDEWPRKESAE